MPSGNLICSMQYLKHILKYIKSKFDIWKHWRVQCMCDLGKKRSLLSQASVKVQRQEGTDIQGRMSYLCPAPTLSGCQGHRAHQQQCHLPLPLTYITGKIIHHPQGSGMHETYMCTCEYWAQLPTQCTRTHIHTHMHVLSLQQERRCLPCGGLTEVLCPSSPQPAASPSCHFEATLCKHLGPRVSGPRAERQLVGWYLFPVSFMLKLCNSIK